MDKHDLKQIDTEFTKKRKKVDRHIFCFHPKVKSSFGDTLVNTLIQKVP